MNDTHIQEDLLMSFKRVNQAFAGREQELQQQIDSLSDLLNQEHNNVQAAVTHVQQLGEREQTLQAELADLRNTLTQAQTETAERERSLSEAAQRHQDAARAETQAHLQQLIERERAFAEQLTQVQRAAQQAATEQSLVQAERERGLNDKLLAQAEARHALQLQQAELNHQIEAARNLEAALRADLACQTERVAIFAAEIAHMRQTATWRLTAPLRRLGYWLGGHNHHAPTQSLSANATVTGLAPTGQQEYTAPALQIPKAVPDEQYSPPPTVTNGRITLVTNNQINKNENSKTGTEKEKTNINQDIEYMTKATNIDEILAKDNLDFIQSAYLSILGRHPDQSGIDYYQNRLDSGYSKESVVFQLLKSKEIEGKEISINGLEEVIRKAKKEKYFFSFFNAAKKQENTKLLTAITSINKKVNAIETAITSLQKNNTAQPHLKIDSRGNSLCHEYLEAIEPIEHKFAPNSNPKYSIVILQYNKTHLTANCIRSIIRYTHNLPIEIILADNGSSHSEIIKIKKEFKNAITVVEIGINRYFGEGNNIGVENANGEYIIFMNNDIVVTENWLDKISSSHKHEYDISGPMFFFPDGRVQECGGYIKKTGESIQQFRLDPNSNLPKEKFECDYISAALIYLKKSAFMNVGGFDLCYEPAYYEDVDLCLKMKSHGGSVICNPDVTIYHNENATSSDASHGLNLTNDIVQTNKAKFLDRWGGFLSDRISNPIESIPVIGSFASPLHKFGVNSKNNSKPKALLYTPYPLTPGGGEKYLLTIAQELAKNFDTHISFRFPYSSIRMRQLEKYLGLNLANVNIIDYELITQIDWTVSFVLGNSISPPFPKLAPASFYICQFPFDKSNYKSKNIPYSSQYRYLCYSDFVLDNVIQSHTLNLPRVDILAPPVQPYNQIHTKENIILSVGRFFTGGHCKNQHLLIEAFNKLIEVTEFKDWKMVLIGSTRPEPEHRAYYRKCLDLAKNIPVEIIPDASAEILAEYYSRASVYWHGAGINVDESKNPELLEHFGITPLEAASAGCMVFVPNKGGPKEIANFAPDSMQTYNSVLDLVSKTTAMLCQDKFKLAQSINDLVDYSHSFSIDGFSKNLYTLIESEIAENSLHDESSIHHDSTNAHWIGWSESEGSYRWSNGHNSSIGFYWNSNSKNSVNLCFEFSVLDAQKVKISLNNNLILDLFINKPQKIFSQEVQCSPGLNTIDFHLPAAHQPGNGDSRILGVSLTKISFSSISSQATPAAIASS